MKSSSLLTLFFVASAFATLEKGYHHHHADAEHMRIAHGVYREASKE